MDRLGGKQIGLIAVVLLFAGAFFVRAPLPILQVAPEPVFTIGGFVITNTLLATWVTMVVLLLLFRAATSNMQLVPRGIQNVIESLVEALYDFAQSVAGPRFGKVFFPLVGTIFFFVLCNSWLSLLPGFGTIGVAKTGEHEGVVMEQAGPLLVIPPSPTIVKEGQHAPEGKLVGELVPFLRGANTDLKTTLSLALLAMFFIEFWGIKYQGLAAYGGKFVNFSGFKQGPFMGVIYFIIGIIETISEFARIISFTFRLFGNMFAGEVLLAVIVFLVPWVVADVFYSLELFVGIVQALVFAGLTLVFAASATAGHGGGHEDEHGHSEHAAAGH